MSAEISMEQKMQSILQEFECPICINLMVPPIRICLAGHSFCNRCDKKLRNCPICRGCKNRARNYGMENIFNRITVPCPNTAQGCTTQVQGKALNEHLKYCQFTNRICPLRAINNCRWLGFAQRSIDHCFEEHASNVFESNRIHLIYPRFQNGFLLRPTEPGDSYHMIIRAYETVFKCVWDIDTNTGLMKWCLICLDPNENHERYYFEVVFQDVETPARNEFSYGRSCCQGVQFGTFQESRLLMDIDSLERLSGERGLYYTVSIYQIDEDIQDLDALGVPEMIDASEVCFAVPQPSLFLDLTDPTLDDLRRFLFAHEEINEH